jgi:hypothetical protein
MLIDISKERKMVKKGNDKSVPSIAPSKTVLVRVFKADWEKLKKIKLSKGFPNYAETVGYVLQKFPEMIPVEFEPKRLSELIAGKKEAGSASPIIDAEKLQNKQFVQLGGIKKP